MANINLIFKMYEHIDLINWDFLRKYCCGCHIPPHLRVKMNWNPFLPHSETLLFEGPYIDLLLYKIWKNSKLHPGRGVISNIWINFLTLIDTSDRFLKFINGLSSSKAFIWHQDQPHQRYLWLISDFYAFAISDELQNFN